MRKPHKVRMQSDDDAQAADTAATGEAPGAAEDIAQARAQILDLAERAAQAEQRAEEINEKYLRALADLENYKRRARLDQAKAVRAGEAAILLEVLPALDNFSRALAAAAGTSDVEALVSGIRMIHDQLLEALGRKGVRPIAAMGEPFDPTYHDAVGKLETTAAPEGTVAVEIQKGYMLGDQVLRPARVMVAAPPAEESGGEESNS